MRHLTLTLIVLLLARGAFGQAPSTPAPLSNLDQHYYSTLAAAAERVETEKTRQVGAKTGGAFHETYPGGAILVGFEVWQGDYSGHPIIHGLRPIFEIQTGRVRGKNHGSTHGQPTATIEAKPGYAVVPRSKHGAGDRLGRLPGAVFEDPPGFDIRLDAEGSYKSEWVGGHGGAKARHPLSSDGRPVIGILGGSGDDIDRLGLLYMDEH